MRLILADHTFDEVHHSDRFCIRACARKLKRPVRCTLNVDRQVSSITALFAKKPGPFTVKPSSFGEAVRKDSAVHVSLSSDSLFKQPGASQLRPPADAGETENPHIRRGDANMAMPEWPNGRSPFEQ